jgi:D-alanyl-D-alanine carboxypeptidase
VKFAEKCANKAGGGLKRQDLKTMRRIVRIGAVAVTLAAWTLPAVAAPAPADGRVEAPYLLADAETGRVIEDFDALRPWFPASTTKLMTVYVVFRAMLAGEITADSAVTYSENAAAQPPSKMAFPPGATFTFDNALKMMMVKSANDVAVAVAESVAGSVEKFAERMNAEAARLGMSRSHFVNPHGLPDERQVTTARDMALLAKALLVEFPQHRDYYRVPAIQLGKKVMKNFNPLLERYPGANGMKTGYICASGFNLVASARRGDRELLAVVFGEYSGRARAERAAELLDEGFQSPAKPSGPVTTLATISSGAAYTTPLDMRPFVCEGKRAQTASEADPVEPGAKGATLAAAEAPVSHLGPPIYLGPPVQIVVGKPRPSPKVGDAEFVARIPKPRPALPTDQPAHDTMNAFAPDASGDAGAPGEAIGAAAGAPRPLDDVKPQ